MEPSLPYRQARCKHEAVISVILILITPAGFLSDGGPPACGMLGAGHLLRAA